MSRATIASPARGAACLRDHGAIVLVSCYELGHQPLAVASPLGFLERAGFAPAALDISVEPFDPEKVARAGFVGISVPMHTALRLGVRVAKRAREINSGCHICFYGLYASLNAEYLLAHGGDSVIGGEFESSLVALVQALESGPIHAVEGVYVRGHPAEPVLARLPFGLPSREALPRLKQYAHLDMDGVRGLVAYVEASRGCLHRCLHCPIPSIYGGRFFVIPKAIVLDGIRRLVGEGATHITFGDPDFLNGPGHSLAIVRTMHAEFPRLTFDFTAKVEHVLERETLFPEFRRLGCVFMTSAVESLSDRVLANLEKGHTRPEVYRALRIVRDAGIAFRPTWVAFTPWTRPADYLEMLEFVEREGLVDHVDPVQFTLRLLVPPRSGLLAREAIQAHLGTLDEAAFSYRWTHPDPRMDRLQQAASRLVGEATRAGEDPAVTFGRLKVLAYSTLGVLASGSPVLDPARQRPPRLTEAWFC